MRDQVEIQNTCANCKHSDQVADDKLDGLYYRCSVDSGLVRGYESCSYFKRNDSSSIIPARIL